MGGKARASQGALAFANGFAFFSDISAVLCALFKKRLDNPAIFVPRVYIAGRQTYRQKISHTMPLECKPDIKAVFGGMLRECLGYLYCSRFFL